ncbi:hypothetical protein LOD99_2721 [Oopsacas minuta]|uniref:DUF4708 domain-containing protein n=1 Tax=Oopsacas minuta TaxID=111878 RepID=A0AAV7K0V7_9METZ|nr:hypothetical protein LOD99_2721 [Oopsacas minuta]
MNTQGPDQRNILFCTLPPFQELTANIYRVSSENQPSNYDRFSTQQLSRYLARNIPSFLVGPADQTSLYLEYSESKKKLVIITSSLATQTERYRDKLSELRLTDGNSIEMNSRIFEECYRFTLYSRLSPKWNRFGNMLVLRHNFLSGNKSETVLAVKLESNIQAGELCLSVIPYTITFRPLNLLEVLNISQGRFMPDTPQSLQLLLGQDLSRTSVACQILPNLTRGYLHSVTTHPLNTSPLQDYSAVCEYWKYVHGYELPHGTADYFVNVSFQRQSSRALTYPLPCVLTDRSIVWRYSPASIGEVVSSFLQDTNKRVASLCGYQLYLSHRVHPTTSIQIHPEPPTQSYSNYYRTHKPKENTALTHRIAAQASQPIISGITQPIISGITQPNTLSATPPLLNITTTQSISSAIATQPKPNITATQLTVPSPERYRPIFKANKPLTSKLQDVTKKQTVPVAEYTNSQPVSTPIKPVFSSLPTTFKSTHNKNSIKTTNISHVQITGPNSSCKGNISSGSQRDHPPTSPTTQPPPAKKPRVSKASINELIKADQLEKANVSSLTDWLREKKITFKSKDKKAQLIVLVRQHSLLMSEP